MCITGYLTDFYLPEIFQLIEKGNQTGLLTLRPCLQTQATSVDAYYIWVYQGRIVAIANQLDHQCLVSLIAQRQWIGDRIFNQLAYSCPLAQPLGLYLTKKGALQAEQLKWLFQVQVLQPIYTLFQLNEAHYEFDSNLQVPTREMTGLSIPATLATLLGLRKLQNWDALAEKLPDPNGRLISTISGQLHCRLNALEWQVWEYSNGTVSLEALAKQLKLPVEQVQQIAYRLIAVGLAEQASLSVGTPSTQVVESLTVPLFPKTEKPNVSQSFLQNLVGFLIAKSNSLIPQAG
jgi:hypothetical protein